MKISIDLGHGVGQDRGAVGFIQEEQIINEVGSKVITKLRALGHTVIEVRPSYATTLKDSLAKRCEKANNNNCDINLSIHANAGGGVGTEIFTFKGREVDWARRILNNIVNLGFRSRGVKGDSLYMTNHTNMTSALLEICFVDTQSDVDLYNRIGSEAIADAIVKGLVGTTISTPTSNTQSSTPSFSTSSNINNWVARLQQELNNQGFRDYNGNKLDVDGIAGEKTLSACPTIRQGAKGGITKLVQEKLVSLGYNTNGIDGIFGSGTYNAVINFQRSRGLSPDGIVGQQSWRKLLGL